jgi:hypothetical protein
LAEDELQRQEMEELEKDKWEEDMARKGMAAEFGVIPGGNHSIQDIQEIGKKGNEEMPRRSRNTLKNAAESSARLGLSPQLSAQASGKAKREQGEKNVNEKIDGLSNSDKEDQKANSEELLQNIQNELQQEIKTAESRGVDTNDVSNALEPKWAATGVF